MKTASVFACIMLAAGLFACSPHTDTDMPETVPEQEAAEETVPEIYGDARKALSELLGREEKTMLVFWTTWCSFCVAAIPEINEFYDAHGEEVQFLSINIRERRDHVEGFLRARKVKYPVALDGDGSLSREYGVAGVPAYIVIGAGGDIIHSGHAFPRAREAAGF